MTDTRKIELPDARWGSADAPLPDWRKQQETDTRDDDEELSKTPRDVVDMLGFDPLEESSNAT